MTQESQESITTTRVISILAILVIVVGAYFFLTTPSSDKKKYTENKSQSTVNIGGEFTLTNLENVKESTTIYAGNYRLVYFGFTYCPDICPTALNIMSNALDILNKYGAHIIPIFVTIDPHRDTPEVLKPYLEYFHKDIVGYTGSDDEIKKVADQFKVYYAKVPRHDADPQDYLMDHSSFFYFLDKDGNYIRHFSSSTTAEDMATTIFKEMRSDNEKK